MKQVTEKYLSFILRHRPDNAGITLDANGWIGCNELCSALHITFSELDAIVQNSNKKRFEYDVTLTRIRACQGHSVPVDLELRAIIPPFELYHGTVEEHLYSIKQIGLMKLKRNFVHLSESVETATAVGARRGKPIILAVKARAMTSAGHKFYKSTNGVWLTEHVPPEFIDFNAND